MVAAPSAQALSSSLVVALVIPIPFETVTVSAAAATGTGSTDATIATAKTTDSMDKSFLNFIVSHSLL